MRESKQLIGAILYLLLAAFIAALACAHYFNGAEPTDELPESVEPPVVAPVVQPIQEPKEETPQPSAHKILDCEITYYCCELYPHICGTGDGLTASGAPVTAGVSCAVDPGLIPLGSTVWVDYGDGELHKYIAQDVGAWVVGGHIDLAVATHDEALQMGRRTATVYWKED